MDTTQAVPAPSLPTRDLHRALGARFADYRGAWAPADYGDIENSVEAEETALSAGCGLFDRSFCGRLVLSGEDRVRFLGGQMTCAIKDLQPGEGTYGFLTSIKGRVEAEIVVLATEDELWLDLPPGCTEAVRQRLAKYVIVERVEFAVPDVVVLTLLGPGCLEVAAEATGLAAAELSGLSAAPWRHIAGEIGGVSLRIVGEPRHSAATAGSGGLSLWLAADDAPKVVDTLLAPGAMATLGAVPVGWKAFERLRVEQGRPLWGVDFGTDTFPQETGLDDAVSYTKGCYLGQEVVARIHYRGGVQRHMRRLVLDQPAQPGAELVLNDKRVGTLTSVVHSLRRDEFLGLGVVHQRAEVGAELEVRMDGASASSVAKARVSEL